MQTANHSSPITLNQGGSDLHIAKKKSSLLWRFLIGTMGIFFLGGEGVKSNLNKTLCFIYANMKAFVAYIGTGEKQLKASMKAANPCPLPLA